jgi:hypothetical protein
MLTRLFSYQQRQFLNISSSSSSSSSLPLSLFIFLLHFPPLCFYKHNTSFIMSKAGLPGFIAMLAVGLGGGVILGTKWRRTVKQSRADIEQFYRDYDATAGQRYVPVDRDIEQEVLDTIAQLQQQGAKQ